MVGVVKGWCSSGAELLCATALQRTIPVSRDAGFPSCSPIDPSGSSVPRRRLISSSLPPSFVAGCCTALSFPRPSLAAPAQGG